MNEEVLIDVASRDIDRNEILCGIDITRATDEEIDALYDAALVSALTERSAIFPPASSEDLMKISTI